MYAEIILIIPDCRVPEHEHQEFVDWLTVLGRRLAADLSQPEKTNRTVGFAVHLHEDTDAGLGVHPVPAASSEDTPVAEGT